MHGSLHASQKIKDDCPRTTQYTTLLIILCVTSYVHCTVSVYLSCMTNLDICMNTIYSGSRERYHKLICNHNHCWVILANCVLDSILRTPPATDTCRVYICQKQSHKGRLSHTYNVGESLVCELLASHTPVSYMHGSLLKQKIKDNCLHTTQYTTLVSYIFLIILCVTSYVHCPAVSVYSTYHACN